MPAVGYKRWERDLNRIKQFLPQHIADTQKKIAHYEWLKSYFETRQLPTRLTCRHIAKLKKYHANLLAIQAFGL